MGLNIQKNSPYEEHLASAPVVATTSVETKAKGEQQYSQNPTETEVLHEGTPIPAISLCRLAVEAGQTLNLGNFNSARLSVHLEVPCDKADLDEVYEWATEWVSNKMAKAVADITGE
jgi:hypothetical protein